MKLPIFKFFEGILRKSIVGIQPRYPRTLMRDIPYPEEYDIPEMKTLFRRGWRACERGEDIHANPYGSNDALIYYLYNAWERGWLECYHNNSYRTNNSQ